jgi:hypothetical protein
MSNQHGWPRVVKNERKASRDIREGKKRKFTTDEDIVAKQQASEMPRLSRRAYKQIRDAARMERFLREKNQ